MYMPIKKWRWMDILSASPSYQFCTDEVNHFHANKYLLASYHFIEYFEFHKKMINLAINLEWYDMNF